MTTDEAGPYLRVLAELVPTAAHVTEQYADNRVEADHGRLTGSAAADARTQTAPVRGPDRRRPRVVQNLRRGHYQLATDIAPPLRLETGRTSGRLRPGRRAPPRLVRQVHGEQEHC